MNATGKRIAVTYQGITYHLCNQRCPDWDHPYAYQNGGENMSDAGCGIFSLVHAARYLSGAEIIPEELADFSCQSGGRGDDGTDRPALLSAMQEQGWAAKCGFSYHFDGLRNDLDVLHDHLMQGNAALCNLRPGHIVALIGARILDGEKQVLAIDSYCESGDNRVKDAVRELIPGSEIIFPVRNNRHMICGFSQGSAMFWASLSTVRDFNLLHRIGERKE